MGGRLSEQIVKHLAYRLDQIVRRCIECWDASELLGNHLALVVEQDGMNEIEREFDGRNRGYFRVQRECNLRASTPIR